MMRTKPLAPVRAEQYDVGLVALGQRKRIGAVANTQYRRAERYERQMGAHQHQGRCPVVAETCEQRAVHRLLGAHGRSCIARAPTNSYSSRYRVMPTPESDRLRWAVAR